MAEQFSFTGNPALVILKSTKLLTPGILRVDAIYYDPPVRKIKGMMAVKKGAGYFIEPLDVKQGLSLIGKMRKKKTPTGWYAPGELPYRLDQKNTNFKGVFGELDKLVLLIRYPNNFDGEHDLLFFHFPADMSNYSLSARKNRLTPDMKEVIAKNLLNAVKMLITNAGNDQKILQMISENIAAASRDLEQLNQKMLETRKKYEESLVISCNHYLEKIARAHKRKYKFSEGAIRRIRTYEGEFHKLEDVVVRAVKMADNLNFQTAADVLVITEGNLNFTTDAPFTAETDIADQGIYSKAVKFLNRLEKGYNRAKEQNLPTTSKNVAALLDNPVKPAAISYSVNYHEESIKKLFRLYPEKWKALKTDFKPILKLVEKQMRFS